MSNGVLVYWVVLDFILVALMLLGVGGGIAIYRAGRRHPHQPRQTTPGASLALYTLGFEVGLALPLAATMVQTCRALGAVPQHLPAGTALWVQPLLLSAIVLVALSLTLGLLLDWRATRRSGAL